MSLDEFLSILHRHASVFWPLMFMAQEPQIPSRHDRRKVRVGSISFLILMSASRICKQGGRVGGRHTRQEVERTHHRPALVQVDGVCLQRRLLLRLIRVLHQAKRRQPPSLAQKTQQTSPGRCDIPSGRS